MRVTVKLPRLGDTIDEAVVLEWHRQVGDDVVANEPLLAVDTAKVQSDVPAPIAGRLIEQLVQPEDEITTGAAIAVLEVDAR